MFLKSIYACRNNMEQIGFDNPEQVDNNAV